MPLIDIFLSRPTWIAPEFCDGLDRFLTYLASHGFRPRTLGATDYPSQCPLDEVIRLMGHCRGAIILGYPQIGLEQGTIKGEAVSDRVLPTEWNHIEAGLAYAEGLPLLVIHHCGISRGIFDHGALNSFVHEQDLTLADWPLARRINGALMSWKEFVEGPPPEPRRPSVTPASRGAAAHPRLSIPGDLLAAATLLDPDYRPPTNDDLGGEWTTNLEPESGFPVLARGQFTGRTDPEYAAFLLGAREVKYKVVVFTNNERGEPALIELETGDGFPRNRYIRTLRSGPHPVSRAVWKRGGPRTLHLARDAVELGTFESASCAYYWDEVAERFQAQWLSD